MTQPVHQRSESLLRDRFHLAEPHADGLLAGPSPGDFPFQLEALLVHQQHQLEKVPEGVGALGLEADPAHREIHRVGVEGLGSGGRVAEMHLDPHRDSVRRTPILTVGRLHLAPAQKADERRV